MTSAAAKLLPATAYAVEFGAEMAEKLARAAELRGASVEELIVGATELFLLDEEEPYDDFSPEDIEAIEEGIAQLNRGEGIPQEVVMAEIKAKHGW